ncbi:MAG TPA: hypothetical protein VND66_00720 [Acidobacteriaceae bacterium]|nr:hypothetical protein [Acidobacteriaceae bacterium]
MPRIPLARRGADQRPVPISRARGTNIARAHGNPAATAVETLAPAFVQALPSLEGQTTVYSHEVNGEMLFELCAALVRTDLGTPELWNECGEDPLVFARRSILNRIGTKTFELVERNIEYHLEVADVVGPDNAGLGTGQLALSISCGGCGYLKIGQALRGLEAEAEGLGAAFYWTLIHSLYRVLRIYDHSDAQMYEEALIEYAEEDEPANRDQYEFPEVEKALPECIRKSLKHESEHWRLDYRRLLSHHSRGRYQKWIRHVQAIAKLSRMRTRSAQRNDFEGYYDGPPLPALLIVFEEHDAIAACFDEESQHMLEGSSEPAFCAVFSPDDEEQCSAAMRAVERFVLVNRELCQLIEEIQKEKGDEGRDCHRGDASFRAA